MHEPTFKEIIEARDKCVQVITLNGEGYSSALLETMKHQKAVV